MSHDNRVCGPGRLTLSFVVVIVAVAVVVVVVLVGLETKKKHLNTCFLSDSILMNNYLCFVKWYDLGKPFSRVWHLLFTGRRLWRLPANVIVSTGDARALLLCYRKSTS